MKSFLFVHGTSGGMTREELQNAADALRRAADTAGGEAQERLQNQASEFESLADAERGPDHGKLARHEHILTDIAAADDEVAADIDDALEAIRAYRETLEGV